MQMYKKYGLDYYEISLSLIELLHICKTHQLHCFYIHKKDHKIYFYGKISQRKKLLNTFPNIQYKYTTGILGMCIRNFTCTYRWISYIFCIVLWYLLQNTMFSYSVYGNNNAIEKQISNCLKDYKYTFVDIDLIKKEIMNICQKDVYFLELYKEGNHLVVSYTPKIKHDEINSQSTPLIAKKDGLIAYFECEKGNKVKHVNDVVYKGEILVDNKMYDSYNREINIEVKGKVYAYTWKKVCVEIKENALPDAINYFSLLLEARNQIHIDLHNDEKVEKENVLQFIKNEGKIKIIILYTLLEDITS